MNEKLIEQEYSFLKDEIFLNVSSVVMPPLRVQNAYRNFMDDYVSNYGDDVVSKSWGIVNQTRKVVSQLIHCDSSEIGFVKNTCEGVSILAFGFPFEKGDNVIVIDQEHQANLFPWIHVHQQKGIDLHVVKSHDGNIFIEDIINQMDDHTRIVAISAIQFSTGFYMDLKELGNICHQKNILFMVDGIQALGRMHIDVQEMHIDYMASGTNKGLLGTLGAGFVYCSKKWIEKITPLYASYQSVINHVSPPAITTNFDFIEWHTDARRFESGNLSYNCILALQKGIELILELGIENIESKIISLEKYLRNKIKNVSLKVVEFKNEKNYGGIVCVYYPINYENSVKEVLKKYKIHCTMRGGYIRLGINFYNTFEQMEQVSKAIHEMDCLG
ncbi:aminotransferase class V-fold PLP-dependent enzyme [Floccifex sp.]|uniref:aminotransferase class V-fold PLP-dependent enzyme n=1 Tax=Floccifex sp. TaxID=2815810 RepID=UPI003F0B2420